MLLVKCSKDYFDNERKYIYDVILNDFLGLEYKLIFEERCDLCISYHDKELLIDDTFFHMDVKDYLTASSMPKEKLDYWNCRNEEIAESFVASQIPVIYGNRLPNDDYICVSDNKVCLGIDIFGSAFFMLTRYEEEVCDERDSRGRFSAYSSLAFKNDFLERPIINEYIELLKCLLKQICTEISYKNKYYTVIPTHDVDRPSVVMNFKENKIHYRRFVGDLIVRKSIKLAIRRLKVLINLLRYGYDYELKYIFDYIMDISEENGLKSIFFFMANDSQHLDDEDYNIDDKNIVNLIKHVSARGHYVGLHPEYNSFSNEVLIKDNVQRFRQVLTDNSIAEKYFGARQHYLRWNPDTWQYYEDSGIKFDATLSYADYIGFRCGICYDYPVYNLKDRKQLKLREYPLIVMEGTALGYMKLSFKEATERILNLKYLCRKFNGNFVILWHNDVFLDYRMCNMYNEILKDNFIEKS